MEAGHPDAWEYTVGRIVDEAGMVEERQAARMTELTMMLRLTILSIPNMGVDPKDTARNETTLLQLAKEHLRL